MKNYLCILLRSQFTFWYRFGYIQLHSSQMMPFEGKITSKEKINIFKEFLNIPFEYDEEYLVFHIVAQSSFEKQNIDIQQIKAIYPLTENARLSISQKIDPRIQLSMPFFNHVEIEKLEQELDKKERKKAISMLWSLCDIEVSYEPYLDRLGIENLDKAIERRFARQKPNEIYRGNYLDYLYAYDRTEYYEPTKLGYFQDTIAILTFYVCSKQENKEDFSPEKIAQITANSEIFKCLSTVPKEDRNSFKLIFNFIEKQEKYIEKSKIDGFDFYVITPIFLFLKGEMIGNNNDLSKTSLMDLNKIREMKKYKDNFYFAVILFAYFFGYKYIYDQYYFSRKLSIFTSAEEENITESLNDDDFVFLGSPGGNNESPIGTKKTRKVKEEPGERKELIEKFIADQIANNKRFEIPFSEIKKKLELCGFKSRLSDEELKGYYPDATIDRKKNKKYLCFTQRTLALQ